MTGIGTTQGSVSLSGIRDCIVIDDDASSEVTGTPLLGSATGPPGPGTSSGGAVASDRARLTLETAARSLSEDFLHGATPSDARMIYNLYRSHKRARTAARKRETALACLKLHRTLMSRPPTSSSRVLKPRNFKLLSDTGPRDESAGVASQRTDENEGDNQEVASDRSVSSVEEQQSTRRAARDAAESSVTSRTRSAEHRSGLQQCAEPPEDECDVTPPRGAS